MTHPEEKPSDRMTPHNLQDMAVENALLRGELYLVMASLKRYHDAPHSEIEPDCDGTPLFDVVVSDETRKKAADAIARAERMLRERGEGHSP